MKALSLESKEEGSSSSVSSSDSLKSFSARLTPWPNLPLAWTLSTCPPASPSSSHLILLWNNICKKIINQQGHLSFCQTSPYLPWSCARSNQWPGHFSHTARLNPALLWERQTRGSLPQPSHIPVAVHADQLWLHVPAGHHQFGLEQVPHRHCQSVLVPLNAR